MIEICLTLQEPLHARPASIVSRSARGFSADIVIATQDRVANGKSVLALMSLGAEAGDVVTIRTGGEDAKSAADAVRRALDGGESHG